MASSCGLLFALLGVCLRMASSLDCYSCFSYESNQECESRYNLKKITCHGQYDTCLKYEMKIRIVESINGKLQYVDNPGFARYCGRKEDCKSQPQICRHTFKHDGEVKECKITCCDDDIEKSKCHKTPHWPGTVGSTNIITSNRSEGNNQGGKGAPGSGTHLCATSGTLLVVGTFMRMLV